MLPFNLEHQESIIIRPITDKQLPILGTNEYNQLNILISCNGKLPTLKPCNLGQYSEKVAQSIIRCKSNKQEVFQLIETCLYSPDFYDQLVKCLKLALLEDNQRYTNYNDQQLFEMNLLRLFTMNMIIFGLDPDKELLKLLVDYEFMEMLYLAQSSTWTIKSKFDCYFGLFQQRFKILLNLMFDLKFGQLVQIEPSELLRAAELHINNRESLPIIREIIPSILIKLRDICNCNTQCDQNIEKQLNMILNTFGCAINDKGIWNSVKMNKTYTLKHVNQIVKQYLYDQVKILENSLEMLPVLQDTYNNKKQYGKDLKMLSKAELEFQSYDFKKRVDITDSCYWRKLTSVGTQEQLTVFALVIQGTTIKLESDTGTIELFDLDAKELYSFRVSLSSGQNQIIATLADKDINQFIGNNRNEEIKDFYISDDTKSIKSIVHFRPQYFDLNLNYLALYCLSNSTALVSRIEDHIDQIQLSPFAQHIITGYTPTNCSEFRRVLENTNKLNTLQRQAYQNAINHKLSLISGVAGTGKTYLLCHIAQQIIQFNESNKQKNKILMCGSSKSSTDAICDKLAEMRIPYVRVYAKHFHIQLFSDDATAIQESSIENEVNHKCVAALKKIMQIHRSRKEKRFGDFIMDKYNVDKLDDILGHNEGHIVKPFKINTLTDGYEANANSTASAYEMYQHMFSQIILDAPIVVMNPPTAGDSRFNNYKFDFVLLDDVSCVSEATVIMPIARCQKHLIMASDKNQHDIFVSFKQLSNRGFTNSLFNKLIERNFVHTILVDQQRIVANMNIIQKINLAKPSKEFTEQGQVIELNKFPGAFFVVKKSEFYNPKKRYLIQLLNELIQVYSVKNIAIVIPDQEIKELFSYIERIPEYNSGAVHVSLVTPSETKGKDYGAVILSLFDCEGTSLQQGRPALTTALTRHRRILIAFGNTSCREEFPDVWQFFLNNRAIVD
ncbi:DNA_helicase [Hexamita inflata]|uniref:Putative n=1 Tax=Hexamita inflata TaxID=28002 RepID=A0AA86TFS9_9EUKA|nr:DNA helicase [Hexamita inflata]